MADLSTLGGLLGCFWDSFVRSHVVSSDLAVGQ